MSLVGCAIAPFGYKYYAAQLPDNAYSDGMLLGKLGTDGWPDIPYTECKPDATVKGKCVTMLEGDFFTLKAEVMKLRADLNLCQHGAPPSNSSR